MEMLFSALASDLAGRLVSFAVDRYRKQAATDNLARLQGLLLRARTVVEEAEGRDVTNQGMLLQLQGLRDAMYRGYYALYCAFKEQRPSNDRRRHAAAVSSALYLSSSSTPTHRRHRRSAVLAAATNGGGGTAAAASDAGDTDRLQDVLEILQRTMSDLQEFVVLLSVCPRVVPRQPYSAYLFTERCMFGRHAETARIIAFLLQPCSSPGVLPVVGAPEVGKRTLLEHVCTEERVREHFSQITRISTGDLLDGDGDHSASHRELIHSGGGRSLVIVEFTSDVDEDAWGRFYSSVAAANRGSKIIVTSRTERAASLGTVQALTLERLHPCEYHYFFRVLAFGSANPDDHHPELTSIATDLAAEINGTFVPASALASLLRSNLKLRFWRNVLEMIRESVRLHRAVFGEHPAKLVWRNSPYYLCCSGNGTLFFSYNRCKITRVLSESEVPKVRLHDLMAVAGAGDGGAIPCEVGKVDVLIWQSPIPPYCSYISNCVVKNAQEIVSKNNGRVKRKRELA